MVVGILRLAIELPGCRSLKEKRRPRQRIRDRVRNRFSVAIAEVDFQDRSDRLVFGIAAIGPHAKPVESVLRQVASFVEDLGEGRLSEEELSFHRP